MTRLLLTLVAVAAAHVRGWAIRRMCGCMGAPCDERWERQWREGMEG